MQGFCTLLKAELIRNEASKTLLAEWKWTISCRSEFDGEFCFWNSAARLTSVPRSLGLSALESGGWELRVDRMLQKKSGRQSPKVWWVCTKLSAARSVQTAWRPVYGRILYNANSKFGLMTIASSATMMVDVLLDVAVVYGYYQHGLPMFCAMGLVLIFLPSFTAWGFLYSAA